MDPRDMKLHLKLQLQLIDLMARIKKKGTDNVIPVKEMQTLASDQPGDPQAQGSSPDFRTGSS